jgi:hypothetical protein
MTYLDIQKFHRKLQQNISKKNVKTFYEIQLVNKYKNLTIQVIWLFAF